MWTSDSFVSSTGETLAVSELDGGRNLATVLMFAGFTSKRLNATNTQLAVILQPLGVRCVACDLSGHGDSTGDIKDQTIAKAALEMGSALAYVRNKYGLSPSHPIGMVGNSFSANAAIHAVAQFDGVAALALKSPVTDYVLMRTKLLGESGMQKWRELGYTVLPDGTRSDYQFIADAESIDTYAELATLGIPVFAVHGSEDEEIPTESRNKVQRQMTDAAEMNYMLVEGGDHNLSDPYFKSVISAIAQFLTVALGVKCESQ